MHLRFPIAFASATAEPEFSENAEIAHPSVKIPDGEKHDISYDTVACKSFLGGQSLAGGPIPDPQPTGETLPAVDGVNAKLSALGPVDGVEGFAATGSVAFP